MDDVVKPGLGPSDPALIAESLELLKAFLAMDPFARKGLLLLVQDASRPAVSAPVSGGDLHGGAPPKQSTKH